MNTLIREATAGDVDAMLALEEANLYGRLTAEQRRDGFVRTELGRSSISEVVSLGQAAVAVHQEQVIGYYLVAHGISDPAPLRHLYEQLKSLEWQGRPLSSFRIGLGPQACVRSDFRKHGIGVLLFHKLAEMLRGRFDLFYGTMTLSNPAAIAYNVRHTKASVLVTVDDRAFLIVPIGQYGNAC